MHMTTGHTVPIQPIDQLRYSLYNTSFQTESKYFMK